MVNTYFRLTERGKMARMKEIRLVSPNYASSGIETLSLPAEVASAFAMAAWSSADISLSQRCCSCDQRLEDGCPLEMMALFMPSGL